jgi:hypothetical protein
LEEEVRHWNALTSFVAVMRRAILGDFSPMPIKLPSVCRIAHVIFFLLSSCSGSLGARLHRLVLPPCPHFAFRPFLLNAAVCLSELRAAQLERGFSSVGSKPPLNGVTVQEVGNAPMQRNTCYVRYKFNRAQRPPTRSS